MPYYIAKDLNQPLPVNPVSNTENYTEEGNANYRDAIFSSTNGNNRNYYKSSKNAGELEAFEMERETLNKSPRDTEMKQEFPLEGTLTMEMFENIVRRTSEELCAMVPHLPMQ